MFNSDIPLGGLSLIIYSDGYLHGYLSQVLDLSYSVSLRVLPSDDGPLPLEHQNLVLDSRIHHYVHFFVPRVNDGLLSVQIYPSLLTREAQDLRLCELQEDKLDSDTLSVNDGRDIITVWAPEGLDLCELGRYQASTVFANVVELCAHINHPIKPLIEGLNNRFLYILSEVEWLIVQGAFFVVEESQRGDY